MKHELFNQWILRRRQKHLDRLEGELRQAIWMADNDPFGYLASSIRSISSIKADLENLRKLVTRT